MSQIIYGDTNYIIRPITFNYNKISGTGKPTRVARGAFQGFSLPTYAADEELFGCVSVPYEWNGTGDITAFACGWLDTANTDKKFNLQLSWSFYDPGSMTTSGADVVPDTTIDVEVETDTGTAAQYQSFSVSFTIQSSVYDICCTNPLVFRLRRLAASSAEITGEFVVEGVGIKIPINKTGSAT